MENTVKIGLKNNTTKEKEIKLFEQLSQEVVQLTLSKRTDAFFVFDLLFKRCELYVRSFFDVNKKEIYEKILKDNIVNINSSLKDLNSLTDNLKKLANIIMIIIEDLEINF